MGTFKAQVTQAWTAPPPTNVALAANGGSASALTELNGSFPAGGTNNGGRKGTNWGSGRGWADSSSGSFPDWLKIEFNDSKTINEIDVFTLQNNYSSPSEPTETMTFSTYGLSGYDVQYWNGSAWITVTGGSITGNNKVWRKITFSPITTTKIRIWTTAAVDNGYSRITEVRKLPERHAWVRRNLAPKVDNKSGVGRRTPNASGKLNRLV